MKHITIILAFLMTLSTQAKADNLTLVCNLEYFEQTFSNEKVEYMFTDEAVISFDINNSEFLIAPALWDINRPEYCRLKNNKKMVRAIVSETNLVASCMGSPEKPIPTHKISISRMSGKLEGYIYNSFNNDKSTFQLSGLCQSAKPKF
jgi:hypothetical protein